MEGKVKHKDKNRKGEVVDSDWLHKAKYRDNVHMNYSNVVSVEWEDDGLSWINEKLVEKI